jgi:hypothetical protein
MLAQPASRRLPEDFDIGPLADRVGGSRTERLALAAAIRFLTGLAGGKVPGEEILPERREELSRSLQYYLDRQLGPSRYRLGPLIELEDGSLRCRMRLFGGGTAGSAPSSVPGSAAGSGSGELYLSIADGRWYVADLQAGLAALGVAAPRRTGKYVPTEAR